MKPASWLSTIFLAVVCVGHLGRVVFGVELLVDGKPLPMWPSIVAFVFSGALAIGLWRESSRRV